MVHGSKSTACTLPAWSPTDSAAALLSRAMEWAHNGITGQHALTELPRQHTCTPQATGCTQEQCHTWGGGGGIGLGTATGGGGMGLGSGMAGRGGGGAGARTGGGGKLDGTAGTVKLQQGPAALP